MTRGPPERQPERPCAATSIETRRADPIEPSFPDDVTRTHDREVDDNYEPITTGAKIGRFRILHQLGEGGMGLIFAAHDAELDRQIALKILRPRERGGALSRARMIREAQALAKLSHPNVVTVYEVGEHKGHVFIAMELVEGRTLRGWLKVHEAQLSRRMQKTAWRAISTVFAAAGRGLAAAHDAGIIHRDFKPTNVIVGPSGRVTVLDFGIALAPGRADTGPLTLAGTIAGTPPYMAPEQVAGALVDPRADQYAFATCLYEALVGERPYKGRTLDERLRELLTEPPPSFPKGSHLPTSLQRAVLRGLTQDPDLRFPSMREFIAAIELPPTQPWRRRLLIGTAALTLAATGYGIAYQQVAPDPICESSEFEIADAWGPTQEQAIRNAIASTDLSYADDTLKRLLPLLGDYRDLWVETRRNACEANLRGDLPTDLYGLEIACLERHKGRFASLTARLADADASAAEQALRATRELPALSACTDIAALTSTGPPPEKPEIRAEVEALRARLETVRVEVALAHLSDALTELGRISARADELGYLPLRAEAHSLLGRTLLRSGDMEAAEQALRAALWWADELRDDPTLASSMAALLRVLSAQARLDEALSWTSHARSVLARLGNSDPSAAELSRDLGRVHFQRRDAKEALSWLDRARQIADELADPRQELVLSIDATRAAVFNLQGDTKASLEISTRVLEARIANLGPAHPSVAASLGYVGYAYATIDDHTSSLPYFERALEIREAALGPTHPSLGEYLSHLGHALRSLGRPAEARPYLERALEIDTRRLGAGHASVTAAELKLGTLLVDLEDYTEARPLLERSHAKITRKDNSDSDAGIGAATSFYALGRLALLEGNRKAASRQLKRALKTAATDLRAEHRQLRPQIKMLLAKIYRLKRKTRRRGNALAAEALVEFQALENDSFAASVTELMGWLGHDPEATPTTPTPTPTPTPKKRKKKRRKRH